MPQGMSTPAPYTPAVSQDFLQSLYGPIQQQEDEDVGAARSEALARGLDGSAMEGSLVGQAKKTADTNKAKATADYEFNLENMGEQENLAAQGQQYTLANLTESENFQAGQTKQQDEFAKQMARMGYAYEDSAASRDNTYAQQGAVIGGLFGVASRGIGGYAASPAGSQAISSFF